MTALLLFLLSLNSKVSELLMVFHYVVLSIRFAKFCISIEEAATKLLTQGKFLYSFHSLIIYLGITLDFKCGVGCYIA